MNPIPFLLLFPLILAGFVTVFNHFFPERDEVSMNFSRREYCQRINMILLDFQAAGLPIRSHEDVAAMRAVISNGLDLPVCGWVTIEDFTE